MEGLQKQLYDEALRDLDAVNGCIIYLARLINYRGKWKTVPAMLDTISEFAGPAIANRLREQRELVMQRVSIALNQL